MHHGCYHSVFEAGKGGGGEGEGEREKEISKFIACNFTECTYIEMVSL